MTPVWLLSAWLASSAFALEVKSLPEEAVVAPLNAPTAAVVPTAELDIRNVASPSFEAPVRTQTAFMEPPALPAALIPTAAAPSQATHAALQAAFRPEAQAQAQAGAQREGARATIEALARQLDTPNTDWNNAFSGAFDGLHAFPDALNVGDPLSTRNGAFMLSDARTVRQGDDAVRIERWDGPEGGAWVTRRRGPGVYEVKEWRGDEPPLQHGVERQNAGYASFWLSNGVLTASVGTDSPTMGKSTFINAKSEFQNAVAHLGPNASAIKGKWVHGTNLGEFNRLVAQGKTPEQAAALTWTGQQAGAAGFARVEIVDLKPADNGKGYKSVEVLFHPQEVQPDISAFFPDAAPVGTVLKTRHGDYTLASSKAQKQGENMALFERWDGPEGLAWVLRKRGPGLHEMREWIGGEEPVAFGDTTREPNAVADFWNHDGTFSFNVETANRPFKPATFINAKKEHAAAVKWFGPAVRQMRGWWVYGDNLEKFNELTAAGQSPEAAAAATWTGLRAAEAGYTRVVFPEDGQRYLKEQTPGHYKKMVALYLKPEAETLPGTPAVGTERRTRLGVFKLVSTEIKTGKGSTLQLERWDGPNGGIWVTRARSGDNYSIKEWDGRAKPSLFGGKGRFPFAYAEFWSRDGEFTADIRTADPKTEEPLSAFANAKQEFADALKWFGPPENITATWIDGTNLKEFNRLTKAGKTPEAAAALTWTGKQAAAAGYTRVVILHEGRAELKSNHPGYYSQMAVEFHKPAPKPRLSDVYDGKTFDADATFPGSDSVGKTRQTRNGEFTLVSTEIQRPKGYLLQLERWNGPGGGVWVVRRRGPEAYEIKEWRGASRPAPFGGTARPPVAYAEFWDLGGKLTSSVETSGRDGRPMSTFINAKETFADAVAWFGGAPKSIAGTWINGTNLEEFNRLTAEGKTPTEAAALTWTGKQAAAAGYTRVVFPEDGQAELEARGPGGYGRMSVIFLKP